MRIRWSPDSREWIVSDVDEVEVDSIEKHVKWLTDIGKKYGWINLPTLQEVMMMGGTHAAYSDYPGYWDVNRQMRDDPIFNSDLPVNTETLRYYRSHEAELMAHLTTRSAHLANHTRHELIRAGYPDRPVLGRPDYADIKFTARWKHDMLRTLAVNAVTPIVLIDDSASTVDYVNEQPTHREIIALLFAGPITPKRADALTWPQLRTRLEQIRKSRERRRMWSFANKAAAR